MFQGFTPEAVEFLWGIKFNNNREWFLPRKEQFLALVDRPMRELGSELFDAIAAAYPKQSLKLHVCRIYRDARRLFGRGPYKDHLGSRSSARTSASRASPRCISSSHRTTSAMAAAIGTLPPPRWPSSAAASKPTPKGLKSSCAS